MVYECFAWGGNKRNKRRRTIGGWHDNILCEFWGD